MDLVMVILSILYLCGCVSGTALAVYGIVFGIVSFLAALIKVLRG